MARLSATLRDGHLQAAQGLLPGRTLQPAALRPPRCYTRRKLRVLAVATPLPSDRTQGQAQPRSHPPHQRSTTRTNSPPPVPLPTAKSTVQPISYLQEAIFAQNAASNPFLRGNFGPVHTEFTAAPVGCVSGALPQDMPSGTYVRIGPNPRFMLPGASYHWFEGDGMIHGVSFEQASSSPPGSPGQGPRARYSNRWIRTAKFEAEDAVNGPLFSGMFDAPGPRMLGSLALGALGLATHTLVQTTKRLPRTPPLPFPFPLPPQPFRPRPWPAPPGTAGTAPAENMGVFASNTAVVLHRGRTLSVTEGSAPMRVAFPSLETVGPHDFDGSLDDDPFTAHPKVCPASGELMYIGYFPRGEHQLVYGVVGACGAVIHRAHIALPHHIMAHDMAITATRTVLLDCPLEFKVDRVEQLVEGGDLIAFDKRQPIRFGVLPRYGTNEEVRWFEAGPGMVFHVMNAYDDGVQGEEVVLVACKMPEVWLFPDAKRPEQSLGSQQGVLTEWRLNTLTGAITETTLQPHEPTDFPTVNPAFVGKPFRYGYAARWAGHAPQADVPLFDAIAKLDRSSGETQIHTMGCGCFCGEPIFVPRAHGSTGSGGMDEEADEDDGYVLTYRHNEVQNTSELVVVDAKNFSGPPVVCLRMPRRVPYGFHSAWVPSDAYTENGTVAYRR